MDLKFRAFQDNEMIYSHPLNSNYGLAQFFSKLYEDSPATIYTGFKDSTGKEIYEGDIIKYNPTGLREAYMEVSFEPTEFKLLKLILSSIDPPIVIGNKFQNLNAVKMANEYKTNFNKIIQ